MPQLQALVLGFKGLNILSKVVTGNLRSGSSVLSLKLGKGSMASKRNVSGLSKPASVVADDSSPKEESDVELCSDEIESFKDDPGRIEKMTVQELRTTLRSVGVPVKGRKPDLISALKSFIEKKTINGESSPIQEEQALSPIHDKSTVQEVGGLKRSKRTVKKSGQDGNDEQCDVKVVATKRKLLVKSAEISGKKRSQTEASISSSIVSVKISPKVGLPVMETEPWAVLAHKKPQKHWIPYNPKTMRLESLPSDVKSMKLMSWNVNGLRALLKLEGFSALELAQREDFDVLCLQETKLQEKDIENIACMIDGYHNNFWTCSTARLGYSGTAIISRIKPLSVKYGLGISDHDSEGRLVTAEFDSFYLICGYIPNSGDGLKRLTYRTTQWDSSLSHYMKELEKSKPVILAGDLNCAHQEIDLYNPAGNKKTAGFTIEERESFGRNFLSNGFVDTFRRQHPDAVGYTYWGFRHGGRKFNRGWRLDYFLVSECIAERVHDSYIVPEICGSDHCPIGLVLKV